MGSVPAISAQFGELNAHQFDRHGRSVVNDPRCLVCGQHLPPGDSLVYARVEKHTTPTGSIFAVAYQDAQVTYVERWEDAIEIARGLDRAIIAALASSADETPRE